MIITNYTSNDCRKISEKLIVRKNAKSLKHIDLDKISTYFLHLAANINILVSHHTLIINNYAYHIYDYDNVKCPFKDFSSIKKFFKKQFIERATLDNENDDWCNIRSSYLSCISSIRSMEDIINNIDYYRDNEYFDADVIKIMNL